jgi:hypothetical protein
MDALPSKKHISSVELIKKTGISRATLNNYIKLGIIAKPIIDKPTAEKSKARRIGYFDYAMTGRILEVIALKEQGHSISEIVDIFRNKDAGDIEGGQLELIFNHKEKEETVTKELAVQEALPENIERGKPNGGIIRDRNSGEDTEPAFMNSAKFRNYSVVVAKLKDAIRLSSELLTSEYALFSEYLWSNAWRVVEEYNGVWGNSTENRLIFFFIKGNGNSSYIYDSFCAAVELKNLMLETENIFKEKKIYSEDMHLNMGIVEGYGFLKEMGAGKGGTVTDLGNTVIDVESLADFASHGSIWTTKSAIEMLNQEDLRKVRYGVRIGAEEEPEMQERTHKRFIRLIDRIDISHPDNRRFVNIATLPVTEIIDIIR